MEHKKGSLKSTIVVSLTNIGNIEKVSGNDHRLKIEGGKE